MLGCTYALNSISLIFRNTDRLCTRRKHVFTVFTQQLEKLFFVLANELRDLRVTSGDLLKNGLEHLRLLLNKLTQLLEMRVVTKEIEVRKCFATGTTTGTRPTCAITSLGCGFKQVDGLVFARGGSGGGGGFTGRFLGGTGGRSGLLLFLLNVLWDTLFIIISLKHIGRKAVGGSENVRSTDIQSHDQG